MSLNLNGECLRSRAPLRISFCGGGTDVAPFPEREGGCVLSATINLYAYATLVPRLDTIVRAESLDMGMTIEREVADLSRDGALALVQTALRSMGVTEGADLFLHTDAPPGSGLGSSSAMVVALVGLIDAWRTLGLTPHRMAEDAYRIEREELGIPGGAQDQYAASFGGFNFIEFHADHVVVNPLRLRRSIEHELMYSLTLFFTGTTREGGAIIERQTARVTSHNAEAIDALRRLKELTIELKRRLLIGDIPGFGAVLHEAWLAKRQLAPGVSNSKIDELYEVARASGAWGGKILGAGGGGYLLVASPYRARQRVVEGLTRAGALPVPFAFEPEGVVTWRARSS